MTSDDGPGEDADHARRPEIRRRAMKLLGRREHAPAELAAKLCRRGYADDDIAAVLAALIAENRLSEQRYAQAVIAAQSARGVGPVRIRAKLAAAAIDETLIDSALAAAQIDWNALARAVRAKRFGATPPADFPAQAKQMRFLQQRGFAADGLRAAFDD